MRFHPSPPALATERLASRPPEVPRALLGQQPPTTGRAAPPGPLGLADADPQFWAAWPSAGQAGSVPFQRIKPIFLGVRHGSRLPVLFETNQPKMLSSFNTF